VQRKGALLRRGRLEMVRGGGLLVSERKRENETDREINTDQWSKDLRGEGEKLRGKSPWRGGEKRNGGAPTSPCILLRGLSSLIAVLVEKRSGRR